MTTRAPPTSESPPAYAAMPMRFYRSSLRPMVVVLAFFAAIWGFAVGSQFVKQHNDDSNSSKLKTIYLALAIMYFVCSGFEIYGLVAAITQRLGLVVVYFWLATAAAVIVTTTEILRLVVHFVDKNDIIASCVKAELADNTPGDTITADQALSLCNSSWSRSTWYDVIFLLLSTVLAFLFASVVASYAHQLRNPSLMRTHQANMQAPSSAYAYPLAPYPPNLQPGQQLPAYAPPSGPPPPLYGGGDASYAPSDDKKDRGGAYEMDEGEERWNEVERRERREAEESTETVTLEPRRETEGRV